MLRVTIIPPGRAAARAGRSHFRPATAAAAAPSGRATRSRDIRQPLDFAASLPSNSKEAAPAARRSLLLLGAAAVAAAVGSPAALAAGAAASSDLVEGTQRLAGLGLQAIEAQLAAAVDGTDLDDEDEELRERRRRFGVITVPGLSSFSFVHGLLVGGAVLAFVTAPMLAPRGPEPGASIRSNGGGPTAAGPRQDAPGPSGLDPELEAALRVAISDAGATFHDPQVHAAIEDVRADIANLQKYRDDAAVMAAFRKLLEIEGILERL